VGFTTSLNVEVYVGGPPGAGTQVGTFAANEASEPALATACHTSGRAYRYSVPLTEDVRIGHFDELIHVVGISPPEADGNNVTLSGSGGYSVPPSVSPPVVPASLTAAVAGDLASIVTNWPVTPNTTSYLLQQQYGGGNWVDAHNGGGTTATILITADGSYVYRLQACNAYGCSPWTGLVTANVYHTPATPSLSAPGTNNTGAYTIGWNAVTWATSYTLNESLNGGGWTTVHQNGATQWSAGGRGTGTYSYQVQACNAGVCGAWSAVASVAVTIPPSAAPPLYGGGTSTNGAYGLSWSGVAGATTYTLYESVNGGGWTAVQAANTGSWSTGGRTDGTYAYIVQGCNVGGCGAMSGTVVVTVTLIPPTPTGLTLTQTGPFTKPTLHLSWNGAAYATTYHLEYTNPPYAATIAYNGPGTTYSALVRANGAVQYRVQACNANGCSPYSAAVSTQLSSGKCSGTECTP
jgi:hypothetical protein